MPLCIRARLEKPELGESVLPLAKAFGRLQRASALVAQKGLADPEEAAAAATDFLRLFGLVAYAFLWTRMAEIALGKTDGPDAAFYKGKLATARFFMARLLPESTALFAQIGAGAKTLMALEAEAV